MKSDEIRNIINEISQFIRANPNNTNMETLKTKYKDFSENYPRLFEGTVEGSLDTNILNQLLIVMKNKEENIVTSHNADVIVGGILVDKFVKPQFGEGNAPNKKLKK
jgi:hypothetical protein